MSEPKYLPARLPMILNLVNAGREETLRIAASEALDEFLVRICSWCQPDVCPDNGTYGICDLCYNREMQSRVPLRRGRSLFRLTPEQQAQKVRDLAASRAPIAAA